MSYTDPSLHRSNVQTYEATKARQHTDRQPDKIHWDYNAAFRDEPYRQLHHQNGIIGTVSIRLLEAADLKRSYWSPLALGPVKHLGLSKAHGDVSSYCTFSLGFHDHPRPMYDLSNSIPASSSTDYDDDDYDNRKPAAVPANNNNQGGSKLVMIGTEWKSSTVVECNNNPVWENCIVELPLRKGAARYDGMRVHLNVRIDEEATAVESLIPGIIAHAGNPNDRLLGIGQLDLTDLVLGETSDGTAVPGVRDEWIPISLTQDDQLQQQQERILINDLQQQFQYYDKNDPLAPPATGEEPTKNTSSNDAESITGMVRVLVSYIPNGLDPEKNDIVALETFARRDPASSSCIPILPPLQPLTVLDRRGPYVLCEYSLPVGFTQRINSGDSNKTIKAQVRLHRNAIFVIERQNLLDAAHNLLRLPIDVVLSTPLGNAVCTALGPAISAGSELLMPTMLSLKLIWMATRATAVASLTGVHALTSTLWREGASSLLHNHNQPNYNNNNNNNNNSDHGNQQRRNDRRTAGGGTAQFVQL